MRLFQFLFSRETLLATARVASSRRALGAAMLLATSYAQAVTISWVPIGNPGNAGEVSGNNIAIGQPNGKGPQATVGDVAYNYSLSKYEITNAQYVEFLNAKAKFQNPSNTSFDTRNLYGSFNMTNDVVSGGVVRAGTGVSGDPFTYVVKTTLTSPAAPLDMSNRPVTNVNWYSAIRFANWMNNGQGNGDTETGAYTLGTLVAASSVPTNPAAVVRNPGATIVMPSESEWYKAAYYNPANSTYFLYPTSTNTVPNSDQPPGDPSIITNVANYYRDDSLVNGFNDGYAVNGTTTAPTTIGVTDVGAYNSSPSPYGTYDQGGNVKEWTEALFANNNRSMRGGSWSLTSGDDQGLRSDIRFDTFSPTSNSNRVGIRLAMIPEPSSAVLASMGLAWLCMVRRRKLAR